VDCHADRRRCLGLGVRFSERSYLLFAGGRYGAEQIHGHWLRFAVDGHEHCDAQ
jgi:hypothetical protein